MGRRWTEDPMDVDNDPDADDGVLEESEDDENDSEEAKALKVSFFLWKNILADLFLCQARRRHLQSFLQSAKHESTAISSSPPHRRHRARAPKKVPGYTVLVVDTNIFLSSLLMVSALIESLRRTIIVPLPVVMEVDGLSANFTSQLGDAAQTAMTYISSHIRSHASSLKVQTSKGNYLTSLSVRTEKVDLIGVMRVWRRIWTTLSLKLLFSRMIIGLIDLLYSRLKLLLFPPTLSKLFC
jgi:protein SMG6